MVQISKSLIVLAKELA